MIKGSTVTFEKGSQFDGYTNNGQVIFITNSPKVNVEEEARVSLHPRGNKVGLYMSSGEFNVKKNATFSIYPEKDINSNKLSNSLYMSSGGTLTVDGGQFNVKMDGDLYSSNPINIGGDVVVQNNGKFIVEKTGGGSQTASLVNVTGGLTVKDKSSLGIAANRLTSYTLLDSNKKIDIQNPSNDKYKLNGEEVSGVVFDLRGNDNASSKYVNGQNIKLQATTITNIPYANVTIPNGYPDNGKLVGTDVTSTQDSDKEPSDNKNNKYLQFNVTPNFDIETASLEKDQATGRYKLNVKVRFLDSYDNYTNNDYPLYLGAFDGDNNKTAIDGTTANDTFKLATESVYRYNFSKRQGEVNPTFTIELPSNLTSSQIKNLEVRGQYIVGDDSYKLGITSDVAESLVADKTAQKGTEGATDYVNNRSNPSYTPNTSQYIDNSAYKNGYDNAKEGYARNAYITGFSQGKVDKSVEVNGYNDAINGKQNSPQDDTKFAYDSGHTRGEKVLAAYTRRNIKSCKR